MGKIQDYVVKNNIMPKDCVYHTWRDTRNKKGEITGKIRVLVPPNSSTAMIEYTCPECKHSAYAEQPWKRPFNFRCEKCNAKMGVPKLKKAALKDAKGPKTKA